MKITLKDGTDFNVTNVNETKSANMWFLNFIILDNVSTTDIDSAFTEDNISEITLADDNDNEAAKLRYSKLDRAMISYPSGTSQATMQLSKPTASTEGTSNET